MNGEITKPLNPKAFSQTIYGWVSNELWLRKEKKRIEESTGKKLEIRTSDDNTTSGWWYLAYKII